VEWPRKRVSNPTFGSEAKISLENRGKITIQLRTLKQILL